jgi:drug/metabolite transporter (DMT)-like permease
MRMNSLFTAQIFAVLSALAFSTGSLFSRYGLRTSTPLTSTLILGLVTLGIYGPIALAASPLSEYELRGLLILAAAGASSPGLARTLLHMSIRRVGLARSVTIINVAPLVTVVLAVAALGERPSPGVYLGTFVLVTGVMLLTEEQRTASKSDGSGKTLWYYFLYALLAGLALGVAMVIRKFGIAIVPSLSTGLSMAAIGAILVLFLWHPFLPREDRFKFSRQGVGCFLVSALFTSSAHLFFFAALQRGPVTMVAPLSSIVPLFTLGYSWLLLREVERLSFRLAAGAFLICAGAALISMSRG